LLATPVGRDLGDRIAGTTTYRIKGYLSPLDVQHGRLGLVGEHDAFPQVLTRHARPVLVEGTEFAGARLEDQLVLQGMQRVGGRLRVALCDVVFTVSTLRRATLDWNYVIATARQHGALPGLSCYLSYVDQIHRDVFWQPLLSDVMRRSLMLHGWGRTADSIGDSFGSGLPGAIGQARPGCAWLPSSPARGLLAGLRAGRGLPRRPVAIGNGLDRSPNWCD